MQKELGRYFLPVSRKKYKTVRHLKNIHLSGQIQDCWNYEKAPYTQHKIPFLKVTVCNMLDKQIKNEINYFITLIILRQNSSEYHSVNRPKWGHSELILSS